MEVFINRTHTNSQKKNICTHNSYVSKHQNLTAKLVRTLRHLNSPIDTFAIEFNWITTLSLPRLEKVSRVVLWRILKTSKYPPPPKKMGHFKKKTNTYYGDAVPFYRVWALHPSIGDLNGIGAGCLSGFVLVTVHWSKLRSLMLRGVWTRFGHLSLNSKGVGTQSLS